MNKRCVIYLLAAAAGLPTVLADDAAVDDALKKGDLKTILSILKQGTPAPAATAPKPAAVQAAPSEASVARKTAPRPSPAVSAKQSNRPDMNALLQHAEESVKTPAPGPAVSRPPIARQPPKPEATPEPEVVATPVPEVVATPAPAPVAPATQPVRSWPDPNKVAQPALPAQEPARGDGFNSQELKQINASIQQELDAAQAQAEASTRLAQERMNRSRTVEKAPLEPLRKRGGLMSRLFGSGRDTNQVRKDIEIRPSAEPAPRTAVPTPAPVATPAPAASVAPVADNPHRFDHFNVNRAALDELLASARNATGRFKEQALAEGGSTFVDAGAEDDSWKNAGPNAWKYDGEWRGGLMHGQGKLSYADGWQYVGSWVQGQMDGQGRLNYPDGSTYEGSFRSGAVDGMGRLTYPDGWAFLGEFRNGRISGRGVLVHPGSK